VTQENDTIFNADTQFSPEHSGSEIDPATQFTHGSMAHFKIIDILGKGGMGAVYKAKDLELERFVAIKMIRLTNSEQDLILEEAKTISKLNHPNIVTVYDIARGDNANFIVMEWIEGSSLNNHIPSQGLPLTKVLTYAQQIVSAIACAHQQGVIHRDIKPQNIMVEADDRIKILDFGISGLNDSQSKKALARANSQLKFTALTGTPHYMAPEQIKGEYTDERSDLFSLGIVLYEMLTGTKPFLGLNIQQITQAITTGDYTPLAESKPDLPSDITECIDKLLLTHPQQRYQTAAELEQDINAINNRVNQKKNWWQQQHWLTKILIVAPLLALLSWNFNSVLFPPSTQELIERQLVESKKIAFLPFDNISGDPVLQIFSDGVASMLSSDLAEVGYQQGDGTTWVLPASEIRRLEEPSVKGIYNEYGVDLIVTGSIQHMGSTRSVNLSLVNGADGRQLKSVQLSINADNLFEAQTHIRQQVMQLIGWTIPTELQQSFAADKPALDGAYKHYLQGQGYLYRFDHADNIERAEKSFQAAIDLDKNYADAYVGLAQVQLKSFSLTQDVNMLNKMTATVEYLRVQDALHPLLSYLRGEVKFNQGNYNAAINLFNQGIEFKPLFLMSYINLSNSYLEIGEFKKAEEILQHAFEINPNNITVLTHLGIFHFNNGQYKRAIDYFSKLATQAPNNYIAYLNISACHYLSGNIDKAILAAKKSLTIQEDYFAYSNLGTYYFLLKDYQKSVVAYEKMIFLNDIDFINWGNLADAYRFSNNSKYMKTFHVAINLAEKVLIVNPNQKDAIASLAYYYANIGKRGKAISFAQKITKDDSGENLFSVAAAYARLDMKYLSIQYLTYAIERNYSVSEIKASPLFESLQVDTEFIRLVNN